MIEREIEKARLLVQKGDYQAAELLYRKILREKGEDLQLIYELGRLCALRGEHQKAATLCSRVFMQGLREPQVANDASVGFFRVKNYELALEYADQALRRAPRMAEAWNSRGNALGKLGYLDEALHAYHQALSFEPDLPLVLVNRASLYNTKGRTQRALKDLMRARQLDPRMPDAEWNEALMRLSLGDYKRGWPRYEARWRTEKGKKDRMIFGCPDWRGEDIEGKTLGIFWEQGFGDTIQMLRFDRVLKAKGVQPIWIVQKALKGLLTSNGMQAWLKEEGNISTDYACYSMSLPLLCGIFADDLIPAESYLTAKAENVERWRKELGEHKLPRIGVAWSGSSTFDGDIWRSMQLEKFLEAFPDRVELICLQKEIRACDVLDMVGAVRKVENETFEDTAALIKLVDLVVTTDTSIIHLAGAMGKETWGVLSASPDWRWLKNREDSPWYPSVKLYRQKRLGDWSLPLGRIKDDLRVRYG